MNAPFSIGQKVVALRSGHGMNKGDVKTVLDIFKPCCVWFVDVGLISPGYWSGTCPHGHNLILNSGDRLCPESICFAPIQTNYADATAEIIEKFKPTEDTPDKIIIPQPINQ